VLEASRASEARVEGLEPSDEAIETSIVLESLEAINLCVEGRAAEPRAPAALI